MIKVAAAVIVFLSSQFHAAAQLPASLTGLPEIFTRKTFHLNGPVASCEVKKKGEIFARIQFDSEGRLTAADTFPIRPDDDMLDIVWLDTPDYYTYAYDDSTGNLIRRIRSYTPAISAPEEDESNEYGEHDEFYYNAAGQCTLQIRTALNIKYGEEYAKVFEYDHAGRLSQVNQFSLNMYWDDETDSVHIYPDTSTLRSIMRIVYDDKAHTALIFPPPQGEQGLLRINPGHTTGDLPAGTISISWDAHGKIKTLEEETIIRMYDDSGRIIYLISDPSGNGSANRVIFKYTRRGCVETRIAGRESDSVPKKPDVSKYVYGRNNELLQISDGRKGKTGNPDIRFRYDYDQHRNWIRRFRINGKEEILLEERVFTYEHH